MQPGRRNARVTFRRRQHTNTRDRGAFETLFSAWAQFRASTAREQVAAGQLVAFDTATLVIPATPRVADLAVGLRATIGTRDHRITSIGRPENGLVEIAITTDLGAT